MDKNLPRYLYLPKLGIWLQKSIRIKQMTQPKEVNKVPITDLKETKILLLFDKNFKIIILKMFSELQENTNIK